MTVKGGGMTAHQSEDSALLPAEDMALTVALAQVTRGEMPERNTAMVCVLALARITGRHDWTKDPDADS